jgi:hypothetical protein
MSRFATDEIPEPMYREFVDGLLDGTIKKYKEEIKEKMDEINNDIKEVNINSQNLLRKMYQLSLVYKKLREKLKIKNKKGISCEVF